VDPPGQQLSEDWWMHRGVRQFYSNWQVLAQKGDAT